MELAQQCFMSMKRRELLTRPSQLYTNFSWEEKAFADDTSGVLGGIVWPPRSYLCSFCNREFRSAQALGGHMNVHRRDRARLKQSLVAATTTNAAAASEVQVLQHQNPNFSIPVQLTVRSSVSSAVSSTKENRVDGSSVPCQIHSFLAGKGSFDVLLGPKEEPIRDRIHGPRETKLSVGLNNSVSGAGTSRNGEMSFKRHKTSSSSPSSLLLNPCSNAGYMEDLDLELRLGDPPKEK